MKNKTTNYTDMEKVGKMNKEQGMILMKGQASPSTKTTKITQVFPVMIKEETKPTLGQKQTIQIHEIPMSQL